MNSYGLHEIDPRKPGGSACGWSLCLVEGRGDSCEWVIYAGSGEAWPCENLGLGTLDASGRGVQVREQGGCDLK